MCQKELTVYHWHSYLKVCVVITILVTIYYHWFWILSDKPMSKKWIEQNWMEIPFLIYKEKHAKNSTVISQLVSALTVLFLMHCKHLILDNSHTSQGFKHFLHQCYLYSLNILTLLYLKYFIKLIYMYIYLPGLFKYLEVHIILFISVSPVHRKPHTQNHLWIDELSLYLWDGREGMVKEMSTGIKFLKKVEVVNVYVNNTHC